MHQIGIQFLRHGKPSKNTHLLLLLSSVSCSAAVPFTSSPSMTLSIRRLLGCSLSSFLSFKIEGVFMLECFLRSRNFRWFILFSTCHLAPDRQVLCSRLVLFTFCLIFSLTMKLCSLLYESMIFSWAAKLWNSGSFYKGFLFIQEITDIFVFFPFFQNVYYISWMIS